MLPPWDGEFALVVPEAESAVARWWRSRCEPLEAPPLGAPPFPSSDDALGLNGSGGMDMADRDTG